MIRINPDDVTAAQCGSRAAVTRIVTGIEPTIFNLAFRMLAHRADAEDACQDILVRIVTHLGTVREPEAAGAWAFRLACRYLVAERRRGRVESMRLTFTGFAEDLAQGQEDVDASGLNSVERNIAIKEVKVGCTLAMLTCLSRPLRIAYILGDVMEVSDTEAAAALSIAPATHRQRLLRARREVKAFVTGHCGIAGATSCSCERRITPALRTGRIDPSRKGTEFDVSQTASPEHIGAHIAQMEEARRAAALMRSNPQFVSNLSDIVTRMFGSAV